MKKYFKRMLRYILKGQPVCNTKVEVTQVVNGNTLKGKKILITGGGRGLGFYIAKKCVSEGAIVLITGRNKETLKTAADELKCKFLVSDVSNVETIPAVFQSALDEIGTIDCLVNNAGISLHEGSIIDVTESDFDKQMDTNLKGGYFLSKCFIDYCLKHNKFGNIVFISSERGHQCDDIPYGLSKAALNSLTKGISRRYYRRGIRSNAVAPGVTASDMTNIKSTDNMYAEKQVSQRFFLPEEVAEVVAFLLADVSKCISGEVIACDAGQYISSYM